MNCYIATRNSRYYAAKEAEFGKAAAASASGRFGATWLRVVQRWEEPRRRDKTGTRTHAGVAGRLRKRTGFELVTYLYARGSGDAPPGCTALVEAALGSPPRVTSSGLSVTQVSGSTVVFSVDHGLQPGDGFSIGGELRVVTACPDSRTAWVSAPFTSAGANVAGGAVSYGPAVTLPSVTLYEYWTPAGAVQRILNGCVVDEFEAELNGDFHEIRFRGASAGLIDNRTFETGQGGLLSFPEEPPSGPLMETPVPGHLGQAWAGAEPWLLETLARARVRVKNNVELRWRDFGLMEPKCAVPGDREVAIDLEIYGTGANACEAIYASASRREPMPLMVQMGEISGAMCGLYVPNFIPSPPEFLDGEERLRWRLRGCVAQGTQEDEIFVVFG